MMRIRWSSALGLLLGGLLGPAQAAAMVDVEATVTMFSPGVFVYDVSVTNGLVDDVVLVILVDAPVADGLVGSSIAAPSGYAALYDANFGVVDLVEDSEVFAAGTSVASFSFASRTMPATGVFERFEAYTTEGDLASGTITVVPEPSRALLRSAGVFLLSLLAGVRGGSGRSRNAAVFTSNWRTRS